jgi:hypothetical protein
LPTLALEVERVGIDVAVDNPFDSFAHPVYGVKTPCILDGIKVVGEIRVCLVPQEPLKDAVGPHTGVRERAEKRGPAALVQT